MTKTKSARHRQPFKNDTRISKSANGQHAKRTPSEAWNWISAKYPKRVVLKEDTVYALPIRLIDAICKSAPGFFTADDEAFERDLTEQTGTGFFLKHPVWCDPYSDWTPVVQSKKGKKIHAHQKETARKLHALRIDQLKKIEKFNDLQIERILERERSLNAEIEARRAGYAGWLATNALFCREIKQLREKWAEAVRAAGDFPRPKSIALGETLFIESRFSYEALADFFPFYHRWCLESLATWDLPTPLRPDSIAGTVYDLEQMRDSGLVLFVPFYMFRDKSFDLHEMGVHEMSQSPPKHLNDWLKRGHRNWGHRRFGTMLRFFIFYELALKHRYPERVRGKTDKLDVAFQRYFSHTELDLSDTVKRIRLELKSLLHSHESGAD